MNLHLGALGVLVTLVCGLGGFVGSIAAIVHFIIRPVAKFVDDWRSVPTDLRTLTNLLTRHLAAEEDRWPAPYRSRRL